MEKYVIILIVISAVILIALASIALYFLVDIKKNIHDTKNVKTDDTLPQNVVVTASDGKFYLNGQSKPRITLKKGVTTQLYNDETYRELLETFCVVRIRIPCLANGNRSWNGEYTFISFSH